MSAIKANSTDDFDFDEGEEYFSASIQYGATTICDRLWDDARVLKQAPVFTTLALTHKQYDVMLRVVKLVFDSTADAADVMVKRCTFIRAILPALAADAVGAKQLTSHPVLGPEVLAYAVLLVL